MRALLFNCVIAALAVAPGLAHANHKRVAQASDGADDAPGKHEGDDRVSLADVLAAAVAQSPGLAMARADHAEGRDRVDAADAIDEWHLVAKANGRDAVQPRELVGVGGALQSETVSGELGLEKSLSTGGSIGVAVAASQVKYLYAGTGGNAMLAQSAGGDITTGGTIATARVTASQPVLRGAGEAVARAEQKVAKLTARAETAQGDDEAANVVRQLVVSYWELVYAHEAVEVDRESEAVAAKQVPITQEIVKAGMQPPSAIKVAELQVALQQEQILRDETARDDQSLALRRLAGFDLSAKPLLPTDAIELPDGERTEADVVAATLAHGPGMAQKRLQQKAGDVAVDAANDGRLPRLDLTLQGELSGVADSAGPAFGNIGAGQMYTVVGGVQFQWDLGGSATAAAAAARVHRVRLDEERADLERQLEAAAISATHTLQRAKKRVELSQVAVDVAVDALKSELAAFAAGRSTNVLVFQRQDELARAKLRLARARIDAIEADVQIDFLTGKLLARYGVSVIAKSS